jgi:hypothetical protein
LTVIVGFNAWIEGEKTRKGKRGRKMAKERSRIENRTRARIRIVAVPLGLSFLGILIVQ